MRALIMCITPNRVAKTERHDKERCESPGWKEIYWRRSLSMRVEKREVRGKEDGGPRRRERRERVNEKGRVVGVRAIKGVVQWKITFGRRKGGLICLNYSTFDWLRRQACLRKRLPPKNYCPKFFFSVQTRVRVAVATTVRASSGSNNRSDVG